MNYQDCFKDYFSVGSDGYYALFYYRHTDPWLVLRWSLLEHLLKTISKPADPSVLFAESQWLGNQLLDENPTLPVLQLLRTHNQADWLSNIFTPLTNQMFLQFSPLHGELLDPNGLAHLTSNLHQLFLSLFRNPPGSANTENLFHADDPAKFSNLLGDYWLLKHPLLWRRRDDFHSHCVESECTARTFFQHSNWKKQNHKALVTYLGLINLWFVVNPRNSLSQPQPTLFEPGAIRKLWVAVRSRYNI